MTVLSELPAMGALVECYLADPLAKSLYGNGAEDFHDPELWTLSQISRLLTQFPQKFTAYGVEFVS